MSARSVSSLVTSAGSAADLALLPAEVDSSSLSALLSSPDASAAPSVDPRAEDLLPLQRRNSFSLRTTLRVSNARAFLTMRCSSFRLS
jgi:hypothetical protein